MYHRADGKSRKEPERPCRQGRTADVNTRRQRERAVYQLCKFLHQVFEPLQRRQLHRRFQTRCKIYIRHFYQQQERMDEMNITYRTVGDYKIPNITLSPEDSKPIGRWGIVRRDYLMKHKRVQFNIMLMTGTLFSHLAEIDSQAEEMFSRLVEQMATAEGITEQLKDQNQLEWVQRMNNICHRATEIVNAELIYV